jgi:hypothetical protein
MDKLSPAGAEYKAFWGGLLSGLIVELCVVIRVAMHQGLRLR